MLQTGVMKTYEGVNATDMVFDFILNFTLNHKKFKNNQADRGGIVFNFMSKKRPWENYCHISECARNGVKYYDWKTEHWRWDIILLILCGYIGNGNERGR